MANASAPARPAITGDTLQRQLTELTQSSAAWLQSHWLQILIALAIGSVIFFGLLGLRGLGRKLCDRNPGATGWGTVFGRAITKTGNFFIVMAAAKLVSGYADPPAVVAKTITFLFTIAAVFQAAIWTREVILGGVEHRAHRDGHPSESLGSAMGLIRLLVTFAVFAIALIVVLDNLGVNVTGLVAGLGIGGIAIGLAAKGIFDDLFAALAIIFDRPFRRGDAIGYDQTSGTVEEIGLKSTRIRAVSGEERIISNLNLLNKEITNNTRRDRRRVRFAIGILYETPIDLVCELPDILRGVVEENDMAFVRAGFVNFGASSLDFEVEFDSPHSDFESMYRARHLVGLAILRRFSERGIGFAYPTQLTYTAGPDGKLVMPYDTQHAPT